MAETVPLREHIETLMNERQKATDARFDVLETKVDRILDGESTRARIRAGDWAKLATLAAVASALYPALHIV